MSVFHEQLRITEQLSEPSPTGQSRGPIPCLKVHLASLTVAPPGQEVDLILLAP